MCSVDRWVSGVCCVWVSHSIRIGCFRFSAFYLHRLACAMWTRCRSSGCSSFGRSFVWAAICNTPNEVGTNDRNDTDAQNTTQRKLIAKHIKGLATPSTRFLLVFCNIYLLCVCVRTAMPRPQPATHMCGVQLVSISQAYPILTYGLDFISLLILYGIRVASHCWPRNARPKT